MTKQLKISAVVAAMLLSASAFAAKPGYLADQSTDAVSRDNYNECWHTTYFDKAADGLVECGDRAAPVPVAAAAPAPAPVAAPTVVQEKVTLSAKVLFAFDKAVLRPEATGVLDPLVARLKADDHLQSVEIDGYTDFMGSLKYNMVLSQKRADAVKDYFVKSGIPADKIMTSGHGPDGATMTEQCKSQFMKKSQRVALKNCLEPDRRVELLINTLQTTTK